MDHCHSNEKCPNCDLIYPTASENHSDFSEENAILALKKLSTFYNYAKMRGGKLYKFSDKTQLSNGNFDIPINDEINQKIDVIDVNNIKETDIFIASCNKNHYWAGNIYSIISWCKICQIIKKFRANNIIVEAQTAYLTTDDCDLIFRCQLGHKFIFPICCYNKLTYLPSEYRSLDFKCPGCFIQICLPQNIKIDKKQIIKSFSDHIKFYCVKKNYEINCKHEICEIQKYAEIEKNNIICPTMKKCGNYFYALPNQLIFGSQNNKIKCSMRHLTPKNYKINMLIMLFQTIFGADFDDYTPANIYGYNMNLKIAFVHCIDANYNERARSFANNWAKKENVILIEVPAEKQRSSIIIEYCIITLNEKKLIKNNNLLELCAKINNIFETNSKEKKLIGSKYVPLTFDNNINM